MSQPSLSSQAENAPQPHPMPVDTQAFQSQVRVHHYINAYYQVRDLLSYQPRRVLIVGVGVGLEPIVLRQKYGLEVVTLDIDPGFHPDVVGSVTKMDMFDRWEFDVVVASHILEHLPFSLFRFHARTTELRHTHTLAILSIQCAAKTLYPLPS